MKKLIALVLMLACIGIAASGCGSGVTESSDKLDVVTTIFPEYDWVREIVGDKADITMLLDSGVDLHSYQPTVDDIMKISNCDVFIYVGGESDEWVDDALGEAVNKDMKVINLIDALGDAVKTEEALPGIDGDEDEDEEEYDEHVWLSLRNAELLCGVIADTLGDADPENAELYSENAEAYAQKLSALDEEYTETVKTAKYDTLVFGDRFPFRYMTDDYGLSYYAAFEGCSAETEASFETVAFLAKKLDESELPAIITIDNSDKRLAETIVENTENKNQRVLTLNSMQSTTSQDVSDGVTYRSIMEDNLRTLQGALN